MRRIVACAVLVALLVGLSVSVVHAGAATDIALGLASFAVFNQIVGAMLQPRYVDPGYYPVVTPAPVVYTAPAYATPVYAPTAYAAPVYAAPAYATPAYAPAYAAPVYAAPTYAAPVYTAPTPSVIHYAHGRYELHLQGQQYIWVWIPKDPPPPPPAR